MPENKKRLECPKCMGELIASPVETKTGELFQIDQCYGCQGIWFDAGELKKIRDHRIVFKEKSHEEEFLGPWRDVVLDLKKSRCPRCSKEMKRLSHLRGIAFAVDLCEGCHGHWLDGGEIRFLVKGRTLKKAVEFLAYLIHDTVQKQPLSKSLKKE